MNNNELISRWYYSYSRLSTYDRCPRRLFNQYIVYEEEEKEETPATLYGTLVHEIIATLVSSTDWSHSAVINLLIDCAEECEYLWQQGALRGLQSLDDFMDFTAMNVSKALVLLAQDSTDILYIEKEVEFDNYKGVIDLVYRNLNGEDCILDWKTTSWEYSTHDILTSPQLNGYAFLASNALRLNIKRMAYITIPKTGGKAPIKYQVAVDPAEQARWHHDFLGKKSLIEQSLEFPQLFTRNPSDCFAFRKKCQFYADCWLGEEKDVEINKAPIFLYESAGDF